MEREINTQPGPQLGSFHREYRTQMRGIEYTAYNLWTEGVCNEWFK